MDSTVCVDVMRMRAKTQRAGLGVSCCVVLAWNCRVVPRSGVGDAVTA